MPPIHPNPMPLTIQYQSDDSHRRPTFTKTGQSLKIELPPMSNQTFLAIVLMPLLWIAAAVVLFAGGLFAGDGGGICAGIAAVPVLLIAGGFLFRHGIYRREPRTVWASPNQLGFRDVRSGAIPILTDPRRTYPAVRVVRSWRRPWVFLLLAETPILSFVVKRSNSIVLAVDTDRTLLESLVPLIEAARVTTGDDHVRGAFEVIDPD